MVKNSWLDISSKVDEKKDLDVLEINFKDAVRIHFRIKNLKDPLFLIGLTNKEFDSKYSNTLKGEFGFKDADWKTDEWVLFKHDCQNFGQTNFQDDRQVLEYVLKIIHVLKIWKIINQFKS